jgi:hypothetical protein
VLSLPDVSGLGWSKVRALAKELAASTPAEELVDAAVPLLDAPEVTRRLLAVYPLGFAGGERSVNLALLHERVPADPSWEVQEARAQAFDAPIARRSATRPPCRRSTPD